MTKYKVPFLALKFGQQNPNFVINEDTDNVVFVTPSFTITCTFHDSNGQLGENIGNIEETPEKENEFFKGKPYTNVFKAAVFWNFGDGSIVKGITASHSYKKAGKYTITCTFLDRENNSYENSYSIKVIAKEVIETGMAFPDENTITTKCGKITNIGTLECFNGNNLTRPLSIIPYKPASKDDTSYFDIKEEELTTNKKFYAFYEKYNDNIFLQDDTKKIALTPTKEYVPVYQLIYGYFSIKTEAATPYYDINLATVIPQANIEEKWLEIKINSEKKQIHHFYNTNDLPKEYTYLGSRSFVDVFFMDDTPSEEEVSLKFSYDLEKSQAWNELTASTNYTNMVPTEKLVIVENNDISQVKFAFTADTFLRNIENHADEFFIHSFVKGLTQPYYIVPFIPYYNPLFSPSYYIPKDIDISGYTLDVAFSPYIEVSPKAQWLRKFYISFEDFVQLTFKDGEEILAYIEKQQTIDLDTVIIPEQIYHNENVTRLVNALTPNALFEKSPLVRELLVGIFDNKNWLNKTITKMDNFYDDNNNPDRCYVPQLISFLRSLNEETDDYQNDFGAVNELNELTRIISMQHTDLVGHQMTYPLAIDFDGENKGENVGGEIFIDDVLVTDKKGFILAVGRLEYNEKTQEEEYNFTSLKEPSKLIVWDTYTKQSKAVSFYEVFPINDLPDKDNISWYKIADYSKTWGWNLILPERFFKAPLLGNIRKNIITGYYRFFILNTTVTKYRTGNFVSDATLSDEFLSPESWNSNWGCCYVFILKLLHEKGLMLKDMEEMAKHLMNNEEAIGDFTFNENAERLQFDIADEYYTCSVEEENITLRKFIDNTMDGEYVMFPHLINEVIFTKSETLDIYATENPDSMEITDVTKATANNKTRIFKKIEAPQFPNIAPSTSIKVYKGSINGNIVYYTKHKVSAPVNDIVVYRKWEKLEDATEFIKERLSYYLSNEEEATLEQQFPLTKTHSEEETPVLGAFFTPRKLKRKKMTLFEQFEQKPSTP